MLSNLSKNGIIILCIIIRYIFCIELEKFQKIGIKTKEFTIAYLDTKPFIKHTLTSNQCLNTEGCELFCFNGSDVNFYSAVISPIYVEIGSEKDQSICFTHSENDLITLNNAIFTHMPDPDNYFDMARGYCSFQSNLYKYRGLNNWILFDFNRPIQINKILIYGQKTGYWNYNLDNIFVYAGDVNVKDGDFTGNGYTKVAGPLQATKLGDILLTKTSVNAQFLAIQRPGYKSFAIACVRVF